MNTLTIPNEILDLTEEEQKQLAEMQDPDAGLATPIIRVDADHPSLDDAPEHSNGFKFSDDLQRQIVSMIVNGEERPYLDLVTPDHFKWESHREILRAVKDLKARCGGLPSLAAVTQELNHRLREKKDAIRADYIGEYGTCRQFFTPNAADENYLRDQVVSFVSNQEVLKKLVAAREEIAKTGKLDVTSFKTELAKLERIGAGGDKQARSFVDANEVLSWPDPRWLIDGVLIENAFGMIYGLPGSMKTFIALDMALSLAHGLKFLNHFEVAGEFPVAYITPEGTSGLKSRLQAWMKERGIDRLRNTIINRHAFRLNEPEEAAAVIEQVLASRVRPKVLFVDTLARNFAGDENSAKDVSGFVNNVMEIVNGLDMGVVVVHHSGKDAAKGARGSIALTGGVDFSIEVEKPEAGRATIRCRKQKEAAEFPAFSVTAKPVGPSLTLEYNGEAKPEPKAKAGGEIGIGDILPVISHCREPKTIKELVATSGMSRATVERYIYLARDHGLVEKLAGHRWGLSVAGLTKVEPESLISLK